MNHPDTYITAAAVKADMGGVSDMWIWRRLRGEVSDGPDFPRPIKIGNRNFWLRSEWEAYKAALRANARPLEAA